MTIQKGRAIHLLWLLVFPVLGFTYAYLNKPTGVVMDFGIVIDDVIPMIPIFVIPYIIWYVYILCYLVYFCFKDTRVYKHTLLTIVIGEIICFICYIFFQSTVARPSVEGNGMLLMLMQFIYGNDEPYNCLPSIHVLTTYAIMLASVHIRRKHIINAGFIKSMVVLMMLLLLITKQDYVVKTIVSILLVSMICSGRVRLSIKYKLKIAKEKVALKTRINKKGALR